MLLQLQAYFADERTESLVFMAFGLVAVLLAALTLWRVRDPLFRGMAVPVLVVGLIQLGVGYVIHARTDAQVAALSAQLQNKPAAFKAQELARMKTVRTSFAVYKGIEGAIARKTVTYDLERQMKGAKLLKCSEFGQAIVDNM